MSEAPQGLEQQYKELTPQQRNGELNKLYQSLPEPSGEKEYQVKLFKNCDLSKQFIMDMKGMDWMLNHPDYTPDEELDQIKKKFEETERVRSESVSKKDLMLRFTSLLAHCDGTDMFKKYLTEEFSSMYDSGINKEDLGDERVFRKLQVDNSESGGIFDENGIQALEQIAFSHFFHSTMEIRSSGEQMEAVFELVQRVKKLIGDKEESSPFGDLIESDNAMLREWRKQYQDRYGALPNAYNLP